MSSKCFISHKGCSRAFCVVRKSEGAKPILKHTYSGGEHLACIILNNVSSYLLISPTSPISKFLYIYVNNSANTTDFFLTKKNTK